MVSRFALLVISLALLVQRSIAGDSSAQVQLNVDPFSRVSSLSRSSIDIWFDATIDPVALRANGLDPQIRIVAVRLSGGGTTTDVPTLQAGVRQHELPGVSPEQIYWGVIRISPELYRTVEQCQMIGEDVNHHRFVTRSTPIDRLPTPKFNPPKLEIKPLYSQELANGSKVPVIQFPIHTDYSALAYIEDQPLRWSFDANPSTQSTDKSAGFNTALTWDLVRFSNDGGAFHHSFSLTGKWNQTGTNRTYNTFYNIAFAIPGSTGLNGTLASLGLVEFSLKPSFEWRERRDKEVSPEHQQEALFVGTARLELPKLYPLLGNSLKKKSIIEARELLDRWPFFDIVLLGYWFPDEKSVGGSTARRFETRAELELHIPIPRATAFDLVFSYGTGAVASNNYARSNSFGIELRFFGTKSKLYSSESGN